MGERIAGKQDRFSLIIEDPSGPPKYPQYIHLLYILFPLVDTYVSTVMRSAYADILVPLVPLDFM